MTQKYKYECILVFLCDFLKFQLKQGGIIMAMEKFNPSNENHQDLEYFDEKTISHIGVFNINCFGSKEPLLIVEIAAEKGKVELVAIIEDIYGDFEFHRKFKKLEHAVEFANRNFEQCPTLGYIMNGLKWEQTKIDYDYIP